MHHEEGGPGGGKPHFHPCCGFGPDRGKVQRASEVCKAGAGECAQPEDHLEQTAAAWERAFFRALHEVRVEMMKERIKASWGKGMKETADGALAAMLADWKKFREQEEEGEDAASGPREALKKVLKAGLKRGPQ